ncbi:hypothetical protein NDU88_005745 [Pleurodeles waltl]|uniref:Uncharacterized protein n=1 Tax=Pleurodeles waltl TaxID=8319 RepID=A0AAV7MZB6_PLEWA|nr:hypothetical protein NDU88_005745 [Pleurodeles waltl]
MLPSVMDNLHLMDIWREMHPTSTTFSCYTPTHGAYSRLDRLLLVNNGTLDIRWVDYQVRFLLDHAPFLLECGTHTPRPAIPLWRMRQELLGELEYRLDLQEALTGYFGGNWTTVQSCCIEWEALKVIIRGKSLTMTYSIQKKLDQELAQQEDALGVLQCQIDNGDAKEAESQVVRGRIGALWSRLDSYVHKDFRQRLHCEGDRSGRLLAWLLQHERPIPMTLSLRGPTGGRILGQTHVNAHLRENLEAIYCSPRCDVSSRIREYLDGLRLSRLTEAQATELEAELSLEDLQGALCGMPFGRMPGPDGLPVEFYGAYSATLLPKLLEMLQEARKKGLLPK